MNKRPFGLRRGIYETFYGHEAYVSGMRATMAYDLDLAERIPVSFVTTRWLRAPQPLNRPEPEVGAKADGNLPAPTHLTTFGLRKTNSCSGNETESADR